MGSPAGHEHSVPVSWLHSFPLSQHPRYPILIQDDISGDPVLTLLPGEVTFTNPQGRTWSDIPGGHCSLISTPTMLYPCPASLLLHCPPSHPSFLSSLFQRWRQQGASETREKGAWESTGGQTDEQTDGRVPWRKEQQDRRNRNLPPVFSGQSSPSSLP